MNKFINFYKQKFSQENLDRTISGGIKSQVTLLLITIITVLVVFSLIVTIFSIHLHGNEDLGGRLWAVYNNFIDPGNQMEEQGWINRITVGIISLAGSILLSGVLISTISNIIERRVEVVRTGQMTYRNISAHYVLIGFNELTISIIRELYYENHSARIVLISSIDTETVRHCVQSELPNEIEKNVLIYFGNIESQEELQRLHINSALEVYVLGDKDEYGRDSKNIATVHKVSSLRGKSNHDRMMPVYVQFDSIPSYSNIQKMNLPENYYCIDNTPNIFFRPFNLHENWARQLWSLYAIDADNQYEPLDYRPIRITQNIHGEWVSDSEDFVHLVIVGFNRMGRSLLLEALRICHYANYDDSIPSDKRIRTHITLIDKEMNNMKNYFKAQFPYIDSQIDDIAVEYCHEDICSETMRTRLQQWAQDKHRMLTVAICVSDPDLSLSLGLSLPQEIYRHESRVLIRQEFKTDFSSMIDGDEGRYKYVKVFGMLSRGMQKCILQDTLASYVNQLYMCCYVNPDRQQKDLLKKLYLSYKNDTPEFIEMNKLAQCSWNGLSEHLRWANRYQIDSYICFSRAMGYHIRKVSKDKLQLNDKFFNEDLPPQALHLLVRMEKHRWNAERSVAGWENGPTKDDAFRTHPLIMSFCELEKKHPQELEKDKDVIHNIPYILALGNFELYKV